MKIFKNKSSLVLLLLLLAGGVFLLPVLHAGAVGDAYFLQDTTVDLTVGGTSTSFTIVAGSDADSVVADTSTLTVTISSGQSFTITSADRKKLVNDGSVEYTCDSTQSSLTITKSSTTTVIITPGSDQACSIGGGGGSSSGGSVSSSVSTPTPTPTPASTTPTPSPSQTPTTLAPASVTVSGPTPVSRGFVSLAALSLKEGDVVSAIGSADPDVYIANAWGYKRLFLNPAIFGFYGHLGGFSKVKKVASSTRDTLVTSGLFRNCETNDVKVYGVESTGEDTGVLHWVNTTGAQAVADDPEFFKKVFCINSNEFNWYKKGTDYTSVNQIPAYTRTGTVGSQSVTVTSNRVKVVDTTPWLNVRDGGSLSAKIIGQVLPNQEFNFSIFINGWYKIQKDGKDFGWVYGQYVTKI